MHARGLWGTYHPELVEGPLPSRSTQSAAWSTPPGSNIKLSAQTNYANPDILNYRYLGLFFPLNRRMESRKREMCTSGSDDGWELKRSFLPLAHIGIRIPENLLEN
jgi:hypothetical protein